MRVGTDDDADDWGVLACVIPVGAPGYYLVRYADSSATVTPQGITWSPSCTASWPTTGPV